MKRSTWLGVLMAVEAACALYNVYLCEIGQGGWLGPLVILMATGFFVDLLHSRREAIRAERGWWA